VSETSTRPGLATTEDLDQMHAIYREGGDCSKEIGRFHSFPRSPVGMPSSTLRVIRFDLAGPLETRPDASDFAADQPAREETQSVGDGIRTGDRGNEGAR
jgi:hypothetical protein